MSIIRVDSCKVVKTVHGALHMLQEQTLKLLGLFFKMPLSYSCCLFHASSRLIGYTLNSEQGL